MSKESRNSKYQNKEENSCTRGEQRLARFPILFMVTIYPLIVFCHYYQTKLEKETFFPYQTEAADFFLWGKQLAFILVCVSMVAILAYLGWKHKLGKANNKCFIPLAAYGGLALISTLTGGHIAYGFRGGFEQFESVWCLMGYCLTAYYSYRIIRSQDDRRIILRGLMAGSLVVGAIGAFQAIGYDFWKSSIGNTILGGFSHHGEKFTMTFDKGWTYSTLYNPNYVGTYVCLILPLLILLLWKDQKVMVKILSALSILLNIIALIGGKSNGGYVCFGIMVLELIIYGIWKINAGKRWKVVCYAVLGICMSLAILSQSTRIKNFMKSTLTDENQISYKLEDLTVDEKGVHLVYQHKKLNVQFDENVNEVYFYDEKGNAIQYTKSEANNWLSLSDELFSEISIQRVQLNENKLGLVMQIEGKNWEFAYDSGRYYYYSEFGKYDTPQLVGNEKYKKYDRLMSRRGYIWRNTSSVLTEDILLGKGADSYIFQFKSNDYVGRIHNDYSRLIMTKPHSMYLQIWTQTGLVSLICLLIFIGNVIVNVIKRGKFEGMLLINSLTSFWIIGMVNDACICVTPLFYIIIGLAICYRFEKKIEKK